MTLEPAPKRRGRPPKQHVQTNPDCLNPACLTTCHPECPNLRSNAELIADWEEYQAEQKAGDPTIRSMDVI